MAECPGGRTTRGTRSQFRLVLAGLGQRAGFYPFGDIMDAGQPPHQTGISSPTRGSTRTVREYEETIKGLTKENFDLKLHIFMMEEAMKKYSRKDGQSPTKDPVEVHVKLKSDSESLQNELLSKDKLLQDALERVKKYEVDFKELKKKCAELQSELLSLSELPSKEEFLCLLDENKKIKEDTANLEKELTEKEDELHEANQRIEVLANKNEDLEQKIKKQSMAIHCLVQKTLNEEKMLPKELRNVMMSAAQAAKNGHKDDLYIAIESIKTVLIEMISSVQSLNKSAEKEMKSSQDKGLKEVPAERNTLETEQDIVEFFNVSSVDEGNLGLASINRKTVFAPSLLIDMMPEKDLSESSIKPFLNKNSEQSCQLDILQENERLKHAVKEKLSIIQELQATCKGLEVETMHLKELKQDLNRENENLRLEVKEKVSIIQDLQNIHVKETNDDALNDYYMNERNELHERLALSSHFNEELLKQLKDLERFLEYLLLNNSSIKNISDKVTVISDVSRCLNESLKLSNILSEHLSICERSKLFEELESNVYKNGSYSDEKSYSKLELNVSASSVKKNNQRMNKEIDGSRLCWHCWQQLNPPMKSEISHQTENNIVHKTVGYPSSESDIWSEPDRNISMQRIGISLQNSPVSSKSPRKLRLKEKRISSRLSSDQDTSSSESQRLSKKRQGSVSRHLFPKENTKNLQTLIKLLVDKSSKLKSLLDGLENVKDGKVSVETWNRLNAVITSLKGALQKLQIAEENAKNFSSPICGKCVRFELFGDLKAFHKKSDSIIDDLKSSEQEILQQFLEEVHNILKELEIKEESSSVALDQLSAELQKYKSDLEKMNKKCLDYENELNQQISMNVECENKLKTLERTSLNEKKEYLNKINALENENTILNSNLESKNNELDDVMEKYKNVEYCQKLKELEAKEAELSKEKQKLSDDIAVLTSEKEGIQQQLKKEKEYCESISEKKLALERENAILSDRLKSKSDELASLEETNQKLQKANETLNFDCTKLQSKLKNEAQYCQQLKKLQENSQTEKQKLKNEISLLTNEREDIMQKLKNEKEYHEKLMKEKVELNQNYVNSCRQISSLKLLNEELKNKQLNLIHNNEFLEKALHSSKSECSTLNQDLKNLRETLQNLESKCIAYEKELVVASGMKDTFIECLLKITNEFSSHRKEINEICKAYASDCVCQNEISEFIPVIDEDNVKKLCEKLSTESKKLLQSVDLVVKNLKNIHLKSLETKAILKKQTELHEVEIENLKLENDKFQRVIDEIQKSILEKEKSIKFSAYEIQSLKEKLQSSERQIKRENQLLKKKDDEISMLQEKISNLHTDLNSIKANKRVMLDKTTSFDKKICDNSADSIASDNQLLSQSPLKVSKICQTSEIEEPCNLEEAVSSTVEGSKSSCCEKYRKKCYSFQTKLSVRKKRIEILEKEMKDLRENFLRQLQETSEERNSTSEKLKKLESAMQEKNTFINQLKDSLYKECNSLIDKQREVDDLRNKLSQYEEKSKDAIADMHVKHSIPTSSVDNNMETLKNYKWKLIQTIFDIQKKFYEKKGIHLSNFEEVKNYVNNSYSMQLTQPFSKSESMPLLGSKATDLQYDQNNKSENLACLKLDIMFLENVKIFLDGFFVLWFQSSQTDVTSTEFKQEKKTSTDTPALQTEDESSKLQNSDIVHSSLPDIFTSNLLFDNKDLSQEKSVSFENFASIVSYYLDCIENFYNATRNCQWIEEFDTSSKDKAKVKFLLQKIFKEIQVLHEASNKLFHHNILLKNFDFVVPSAPVFNRPDTCDRESLLSEETIAVSRTVSLSFENECDTELPPCEVSESKGKTKLKSSSCDSICQRSHYSSPDLGIESDPNHDSSAPEQKDDNINKYQRLILEEQKFKMQQKSVPTKTKSAGRWSGHKFGESLYAIGNLPDYELLKKEVKECLIAIKSVLSRTGDGLHHVVKSASPRKTLEYNTLKSIRYSCEHIQVCLKAADEKVGKFWTAPCPSEEDWKFLIGENQSLCEQLEKLNAAIQKRKSDFDKATTKLKHAQVQHANMEKEISKKLVKTKKVIRQAELKLLENRCQNFPPLPKYPSDKSPQA